MKSPPSEYTFICTNVNEKLQFGGNDDEQNLFLKYPLGQTSLDGIHGVRRQAFKNSQMAYAVWQYSSMHLPPNRLACFSHIIKSPDESENTTQTYFK